MVQGYMRPAKRPRVEPANSDGPGPSDAAGPTFQQLANFFAVGNWIFGNQDAGSQGVGNFFFGSQAAGSQGWGAGTPGKAGGKGGPICPAAEQPCLQPKPASRTNQLQWQWGHLFTKQVELFRTYGDAMMKQNERSSVPSRSPHYARARTDPHMH